MISEMMFYFVLCFQTLNLLLNLNITFIVKSLVKRHGGIKFHKNALLE